MKILLTAAGDFPINAVADLLEENGIEVRQSVASVSSSDEALPDEIRTGVLIFPCNGLDDLGSQVVQVRQMLGENRELLVCCGHLTEYDREILHECGGSSFVTPKRWTNAAVAERILAEFFLAGDTGDSSFGGLRGETLSMRRVYQQVETVAPLSDPVLILGETGTGKELIAWEIHKRSRCSDKLMPLNCAALTSDLLESELFGYERGAFTGAVSSRKGLLSLAGNGTVFLDEIGDLASSSQGKLLRVLEEKKMRPVGSSRWHPFEARLLLATNRDLDKDCEERRFRRDLYERIRGFTLHLPPLRERKADLLLLTRHFVEQYNSEYSCKLRVPSEGLDPLFRHDWPGNVRELRNIVRQAAAYADSEDGPISVLHILEALRGRRSPDSKSYFLSFDPGKDTWHTLQNRARALYFRSVLAETGGNKAAAAKRAGISRTQFYEIWRQINQDRESDPDS